MSKNLDFSSKVCGLPKISELYPFKYFLLQAAKREQESDQNADDNDAIQTEDESVHDKIKKAYDRSKHSYK